VRIIAATNRHLEDEVRAGRFRQDLFYRLSVVRVHLPSLRERTDDIHLLVNHFLKTLAGNRGADGTQRVMRVAREAMSALVHYPWPGNVRELVNVIERAVSFGEGDAITLADLPEAIREAKTETPPPVLRAPTPPPGRARSGGHATTDQTAPRPP